MDTKKFELFSLDKGYEHDLKLRRQDVQSLMQWVKTQPHLPEVSEHEAVLFLKSCYYNNELSKTALDNFYSIRSSERYIFKTPEKSVVETTIKYAVGAILSKKTPDGDSIYYGKLTKRNSENFDTIDTIRLADLIMTLGLFKNEPLDGLQVLFDLENVTVSLLTKLNLTAVKKALEYVQVAVPVRLKAVHLLHCNKSLMDMMMTLMRSFMSKELIDMIHAYNDINELTKVVPLECLPKNYGGEDESTDSLPDKILKNFLENKELFEYQDSQLVDESRRPKDSRYSPEIYGLSGTFKTLELD